MKKPIGLIVLGLIVFALVGVWLYLLLNGSPQVVKDNFTDLGTEGEEVEFIPTPETPEEVAENLQGGLKQITTRPVAGYRVLQNATGSVASKIYVAEPGTGHIYIIDQATREERKISNITIQDTSRVIFSKDGQFVVFATSDQNNKNFKLFAGTINEELGVNLIDFEDIAENFTVNDKNEILYGRSTADGYVALSYSLINSSRKTLFSLPFREARIIWDNSASSTHYAHPKASASLSGALYKVLPSGSLERTKVAGFGMSAITVDNNIIFGLVVDGEYQTRNLNSASNTVNNLDRTVIPEKCFPLESEGMLICGQDDLQGKEDLPDSWHRGEEGFADRLIYLDLTNNTSILLTDTFVDSQQNLDVIEINSYSAFNNIYFKNKNDDTLWMYEII